MSKIVTLPMGVPPFTWITHIELDEIYVNPGVFAKIRFYPGNKKNLPDPTWIRPLIADPTFVPPSDNPTLPAPLIPDALAVAPNTLQFVRDRVIPAQTREISGSVQMAAIETLLIALSDAIKLAPDIDGLNSYERAVVHSIWIEEGKVTVN